MAKKVAPAVEKNRYSPEELQEFKDLIIEKIAKAEKDLEMLQEAVAGNENEASDTAPTFKTLEEGSNVLLKEENQKLAASKAKLEKQLKPRRRHGYVPHHRARPHQHHQQNLQRLGQVLEEGLTGSAVSPASSFPRSVCASSPTPP